MRIFHLLRAVCLPDERAALTSRKSGSRMEKMTCDLACICLALDQTPFPVLLKNQEIDLHSIWPRPISNMRAPSLENQMENTWKACGLWLRRKFSSRRFPWNWERKRLGLHFTKRIFPGCWLLPITRTNSKKRSDLISSIIQPWNGGNFIAMKN